MKNKDVNMKQTIQYLILLFLLITCVQAQNIKWRRSEKSVPPLELFHSTHVINLPTAETLQKGDFEFEISHRFVPALQEGYRSLWGLDGPADIRLALGYAPADEIIITLGRTNVNNNLDLQFRYQMIKIKNDIVPVLGTLNLGSAWNSYIADRPNDDTRNFQYFAQFAVNTLLFENLGIGIVPAYLYNSAIFNEDNKYSITLGNYVQYYISTMWSVMIEWNPTLSGWRDSYNSLSIGLELETGGHFFKLFVTNNVSINTAQFMAGADKRFNKEGIRLGFLITRLI